MKEKEGGGRPLIERRGRHQPRHTDLTGAQFEKAQRHLDFAEADMQGKVWGFCYLQPPSDMVQSPQF